MGAVYRSDTTIELEMMTQKQFSQTLTKEGLAPDDWTKADFLGIINTNFRLLLTTSMMFICSLLLSLSSTVLYVKDIQSEKYHRGKYIDGHYDDDDYSDDATDEAFVNNAYGINIAGGNV